MKSAKDLMKKRFLSLSPEDSIFTAAKIFHERGIKGALVIEKQRLKGIVTVTDVVKFLNIKTGNLPNIRIPGISELVLAFLRTIKVSYKLENEVKKIMCLKVKDIMTTDVLTVTQSTKFLDITEIMLENNIDILPVVSRNKVIGIVTSNDLMNILIEKPKKSRISRIKNHIKKKSS